MTDQLKQYRDKIDAIDDEVLKLVNARAKLARQIGGLKEDGVIYRPEREAQVLRRLQAQNQGPLENEAVSHIFRAVMSNCRALEKKHSVAFLGPIGSYSEMAALKQFGTGQDAVLCDSIDNVFRSTALNSADYGVVPVENSSEGAVGRTLDLLVETKLKVCAEVELPVHHCLLSLSEKPLSKSNIKVVYGHSQALAQCQEWLAKNLPNSTYELAPSNSHGARLAGNKRRKLPEQTAAIASKRAAELYDLNILAENIEDDVNNTTRFLILGKHEVAASGHDKTSLVLSAKNKPGAMVELLEPLARHGVSMTKLESRPSKIELWNYVFFVDIEGHQTDKKVQAALVDLRARASSVKVLGSYPTAVI